METRRSTVIAGTGSYIPSVQVPNAAFRGAEFFAADGSRVEQPPERVIAKFEDITGILERRYVPDHLLTSDIAGLAAEDALATSGIDRESLDYVIVAHNFGDVAADNRRSDFLPSLAARVKAKLRIKNPRSVAYDLAFGCPGWLQGVIQADYFLKAGGGERALVIGAETLSRVSDPHDRDSMIYADGAGATILEARPGAPAVGVLSHAARSDTLDHAYLLSMKTSFSPNGHGGTLFLKMDGHKVYEYALRTVPEVVEECLAKAGLGLAEVRKVLLHQANAKMDHAILKRLLRSAGVSRRVSELAPMTVGWLGNSSVATLPTLFDLLSKGRLDEHAVAPGDVVLFASVGAGMNVNAVAYRMP